MKKLILCFTVIILTFTFTACPSLFDDLDKHKFMEPEELLAKMNKNFGNHFTLVNYEKVEKKDDYKYDDCKYLVVTLKADDLPGQEVKAYQMFEWSFGEELTNISQAYTDPARTTINIVEEYLVTDYYFLKFKDDLFAEIKKVYEPLLTNLNEKDYLLAIKPDLLYFPIEKTHYAQNNYKNAADILEHAYTTNYLLIHSGNYPEEEKINSISKSIHEFGHYTYFNGYLYYSSKYSPSEVTTKALINGNFYNITDIQNNLLVKYQVY